MKNSLLLILFLLLILPSVQAASDLKQILAEQDIAVFIKGQAIYDKHCAACHIPSNIMVASPKLGDRDDWGTRLANNKNLKGLVNSALKGKGAMPPKGLCLECKTKDLEAAIVFMIKGS